LQYPQVNNIPSQQSWFCLAAKLLLSHVPNYVFRHHFRSL
jgi:hypothetical protein